MTTENDQPEAGPSTEPAENGEARTDREEPRSGPFQDLQDLVEDLFENVRSFAPVGVPRGPRLELTETAEEWRLQVDLPGVQKEEVEVTTSGGQLTIAGRRGRPDYPPGARVRRTERTYGRFERTVRLPGDVDPDAIRARLEDGVLEIRLPRRGEGGRRVEVES
jgi:HSP20 family protein